VAPFSYDWDARGIFHPKKICEKAVEKLNQACAPMTFSNFRMRLHEYNQFLQLHKRRIT
jgi:hypothetical protein